MSSGRGEDESVEKRGEVMFGKEKRNEEGEKKNKRKSTHGHEMVKGKHKCT